jgi:uncharacterized membrane protein
MPYPQNFIVRLIICVVGMCAIWILGSFISATLIHHEEFVLRATHFIIPAIMGVVEAFVWKPKDK